MKNLVNKLDWVGLSCQDRALALGCEDIKKDSALFFMLFKFAGNDYLLRNYELDISDDQYYEYLSRKMGISIELKMEDSNKIHDIITANYSEDERIVLVINCINDVNSRMYKKESHPHFILLQGSCLEKEAVRVVDEDYSGEFWKAQNSQNGVVYIENEIPVSDMIQKCKDVNLFSKMKTDEDICAYYHLKRTDNKECSVESILKQFYDQIDEYLWRKDKIKKYSLEKLLSFTGRIEEVKNQIISDIRKKLVYASEEELDKLNDDFYLYKEYSSWLAYPYESKIISAHHQFLYLVSVVFREMKLNTENTENAINELLKGYDELKSKIAYIVLSKNPEECEFCVRKFKELLELEDAYFKELCKNVKNIK